jgi:hypothetical protein
LGVKAMVMENSMLPGLEVGSGCCVMKWVSEWVSEWVRAVREGEREWVAHGENWEVEKEKAQSSY